MEDTGVVLSLVVVDMSIILVVVDMVVVDMSIILIRIPRVVINARYLTLSRRPHHLSQEI